MRDERGGADGKTSVQRETHDGQRCDAGHLSDSSRDRTCVCDRQTLAIG